MISSDIEAIFHKKLPARGRDDLAGPWYSAFQPNSAGHPEAWHREKATIETSDAGDFVCTTIAAASEKIFNWIAVGTVYNGEVIVGKWASRIPKRQTAGTFMLRVEQTGTRLVGFCLGES